MTEVAALVIASGAGLEDLASEFFLKNIQCHSKVAIGDMTPKQHTL
jgi:hypothetical protein